MRAITWCSAIVLCAAGLAACGKVKVPANWFPPGGEPDMALPVDGGGGSDAGDMPIAPNDLSGPCGACSLNATCDESKPVGQQCTCKSGFTGDGKTCNDDNECQLGTANCDSNATCTNTVGAFTCTCANGYRSTGTMMGRVGECEQIWVQQNITDESPDGGVPPSDMGFGSVAATAKNTAPASTGLAVGSGSKIYLAPWNLPCNAGDDVFFRVFDTMDGTLTTAVTAPIDEWVCRSVSGYPITRPLEGPDKYLYFVSYGSYTRYNLATKSFAYDLANVYNMAYTWEPQTLSFGINGEYNLPTRATTSLGSTAWFFGGEKGNAKQSAVHKMPLTAATPTPTLMEAMADLPLQLTNAVAIPIGTDIFIAFGRRDGAVELNSKVLIYNTLNNTFNATDETSYNALPDITLPSGINASNLSADQFGARVVYQGKLWFLYRTWNGSQDVAQLWSFDPVTRTFSGGAVVPPSVGNDVYKMRLARTSGGTAGLYLIGKGVSALEIYRYNE